MDDVTTLAATAIFCWCIGFAFGRSSGLSESNRALRGIVERMQDLLEGNKEIIKTMTDLLDQRRPEP